MSSNSYNDKQERENPLNWMRSLNQLTGAYADGTLRAYRADIAAFEAWCVSNHQSFIPTTPETVANYISTGCCHLSSSTIKRRLAAITKIHHILRFQNPVTDEEVRISLRRALRQKHARPKQALGLTKEFRDKLMKFCPTNLSGKRDRALIAVGYDTLCRRSELVGLLIEDLKIMYDGTARILVRKAKNDQVGNGRMGYISAKSLKVLLSWTRAAHIHEGYIFRAVRDDYVSKQPLSPYSVNRILKSCAIRAGLPKDVVGALSGHSMRVGAAQDLIQSGLGLLPIMQLGGWKATNVVGRYVENANLTPLLKRARSGKLNSKAMKYF